MTITSPYKGKAKASWLNITKKLVKVHPLDCNEIVEIALESWEDILLSKIGKKYKLGIDILPKPQIMGFLLHELIPLKLNERYPCQRRKEQESKDKDAIYIPNEKFSIEIKTSSSPKNIFGNRSYAQKGTKNKKVKSGYYLAINFEKFGQGKKTPKILKIRFGWLDHADWKGQKSQTGQQAKLNKSVEEKKLLQLYPTE